MKKKLKYNVGDLQIFATTPANGSDTFPATPNEFYTAVETIAVQNIRGVKSTNRIEDAFYDYQIDGNGNVIEEAIIHMAEAGNFVKTGAPDFSPSDPTLSVRYFNNWTEKQFRTSIRKDEIRRIIADKSTSAEEVASEILGTLNEGESDYDYSVMRDALKNTNFGYDASSLIFGNKTPKNMKGVLYCLRQMYNAVKATNDIGTGLSGVKQGVMPEDVRIAISEDVLNLVDVTELANVFNLEKEKLMGQLVVIPHDDDYTPSRLLVYDRKAFGRGTRVYDYSQDVIGVGRYTNHYLTTERAYFYNPIFKCFYLNIATAIANAEADIMQAVE